MALLPRLSSGVLGSSLKGNLCHNKSSLRPAGREPLGLKRWWRWRRQWDDETCGNGWMGCQVEVSQALKRERPRGVTVQSSPSVLSWNPGCFHCPHPRAVSGAVTVLWCPLHGSDCVSWEEDCPPVRSGPLRLPSLHGLCALGKESWPPTLKWKLLHLWWHCLDYPCE